MRRLSSCVLALFLGASAVTCTGSDGGGAAHNIVVALPLSSEYAALGDFHQAAIEMALVDLEAAGLRDLLGKPLRVLPINAGPGATFVRQQLEEIVREQGILGVSAVISSTDQAYVGTLPFAVEKGVPHFEVASGMRDGDFLVTGFNMPDYDLSYSFATRGFAVVSAEIAGDFIAAHPEREEYTGDVYWGKVALVREDTVQDKAQTTAVRNRLSRYYSQGARVLDSGDAANAGDFVVGSNESSFEGVIAAAMNSSELGVIFFSVSGDAAWLSLLRDAERLGYRGRMVAAGPARASIVTDERTNGGLTSYLEGRLYMVMRGPLETTRLDTFNTDFTRFSKMTPDAFASSAYDAMVLTGLAIAAAGGDPSHAQIRDAVEQVAAGGEPVGYGDLARAVQLIRAGADLDYDGASGTLEFRADHSVPASYWIEEVKHDAQGYRTAELSAPPRQTR